MKFQEACEMILDGGSIARKSWESSRNKFEFIGNRFGTGYDILSTSDTIVFITRESIIATDWIVEKDGEIYEDLISPGQRGDTHPLKLYPFQEFDNYLSNLMARNPAELGFCDYDPENCKICKEEMTPLSNDTWKWHKREKIEEKDIKKCELHEAIPKYDPLHPHNTKFICVKCGEFLGHEYPIKEKEEKTAFTEKAQMSEKIENFPSCSICLKEVSPALCVENSAFCSGYCLFESPKGVKDLKSLLKLKKDIHKELVEEAFKRPGVKKEKEMSELSEFGKGFGYCLGLFLAHQAEWQNMRPKDTYAELWFHGATDHLFEFDSENAPISIRARCKLFKEKCISWRNYPTFNMVSMLAPTWQDVDWALQEAKDILIEYDKLNGFDAEKGDYQ